MKLLFDPQRRFRHNKLSKRQSKHVTSNGKVVWDAFAGYDADGFALSDVLFEVKEFKAAREVLDRGLDAEAARLRLPHRPRRVDRGQELPQLLRRDLRGLLVGLHQRGLEDRAGLGQGRSRRANAHVTVHRVRDQVRDRGMKKAATRHIGEVARQRFRVDARDAALATARQFATEAMAALAVALAIAHTLSPEQIELGAGRMEAGREILAELLRIDPGQRGQSVPKPTR